MVLLALRGRRWPVVALALAAAVAFLAWQLAGWLIGVAVVALFVLVAAVAGPALLLRGWWRLLGGLAGLVGFVALALLAVKLRYGGGERYPDLRTPPRFAESALETLVTVPYPPCNVAVSASGRIFFNYHPLARPQRFSPATVFELVGGEPRPYPDGAFQKRYQGVFGMTVDRQGRLWFTEPASLDHARTRLLAFDLSTDALVFEYQFPPGVARFAQDLRISPDGHTVYLADTGLLELLPASLIVLDLASLTHRQVLIDHGSTRPQGWRIRTRRGEHVLAWGLVNFVIGVDGLELSPDGAWLYYAAISHDTLYKVPTAALRDATLSADQLARQVVAVGKKPMSDGLAVDRDGSVLITDVEHGAVHRMAADGTLETLVSSPRILWADGVAVAPGGELLITDSAIPAFIHPLGLPPAREVLAAGAPYHVFRLRR
jgi:sugar lactone lactonase YvrE